MVSLEFDFDENGCTSTKRTLKNLKKGGKKLSTKKSKGFRKRGGEPHGNFNGG